MSGPRATPPDDPGAIRRALYENVRLGRMEVFINEDGEERFRLTEEGERAVEEMIDDAE